MLVIALQPHNQGGAVMPAHPDRGERSSGDSTPRPVPGLPAGRELNRRCEMHEPVDPHHLLLIGAGPGVGAAVVLCFGRERFRSPLISRGGTLDQLARELRSGVLEIDAIAADVADLDAYRETLERIFSASGPPVSSCTTPPCSTRARSSAPPSSGSEPPTTSMSSAPSSRTGRGARP